MEFKALQREPVEGFLVTIQDEDFYTWQVAIFGPPDTPYQGGYFKVCKYKKLCVYVAFQCSNHLDFGSGWGMLLFLPSHPGWYTQAQMKFPVDYPYSPPKLRFLSPILHPNVYTVCVSQSQCLQCLHVCIPVGFHLVPMSIPVLMCTQ